LEPLLYLTHRIPFPPNKGDKVRSFHLLKFLASHASVHVGTFIDDPADVEHVPALGAHCASLKAVRIDPHGARLRSMAAHVFDVDCEGVLFLTGNLDVRQAVAEHS